MKLSLSTPALSNSLKRIADPLVKHHVLIVLSMVFGFLIFAVFTVNQIITTPPDQTYIDEKKKEFVKTRFDEQTIKAIDNLRNRRESGSLALPEGRNNPFREN